MNHLAHPRLAEFEPAPATLSRPRRPRERNTLVTLLASLEATIIITALRATGGNQRRAAEALGLLPTTLQEKMKRHGLRTAGEVRSLDRARQVVEVVGGNQ